MKINKPKNGVNAAEAGLGGAILEDLYWKEGNGAKRDLKKDPFVPQKKLSQGCRSHGVLSPRVAGLYLKVAESAEKLEEKATELAKKDKNPKGFGLSDRDYRVYLALEEIYYQGVLLDLNLDPRFNHVFDVFEGYRVVLLAIEPRAEKGFPRTRMLKIEPQDKPFRILERCAA